MPYYGGHATDVVGYAWNADEFCPPCVFWAVVEAPSKETSFQADRLEAEIEAYVKRNGIQVHREDSNVVPQPIFNGEDARDEDGRPRHCGRCHEPLVES